MIALLNPSTQEERELRLKLGLLIGQSVSLGTALSLLIIVGNALFLPLYGAGALPYVYITVAILGSLVSYGSTELQRRWSLPRVTISITAAIAIFFAIAWVSLIRGEARWAPFALLVLFPLFIQLGFVFLGGQAGRLLDVRQIRRFFPQIVAGFVIGFMVGGLAMPMLVTLLGSTEGVMLAIVAITLNFLAFMVITTARFKTAFAYQAPGSERAPTRSLRKLLSHRFVLLIFLYQVLVAVVNQLADFILLAQAGARYTDSESIGQFFSTFTVVLNGLDLFVLLVVASYYLGRFGLRAGLLANPVTGLLFFVLMMVAGLFSGPSSTIFFILVSAARISNIVFNDGTSRTSLNATYQALPAGDRAVVQTAAEGIGAPLAIGAVGILLLLYNAIGSLSILHVVGLTLIFSLLWVIVGNLLYRNYAGSLIRALNRRVLGKEDLSLADGTSMGVIQRLLEKGQLREKVLALDALEQAEHASIDTWLLSLLERGDPAQQREILARIERRHVRAATKEVARLLDTTEDDALLSAALRAFAALAEADSVEKIGPYLDHDAMEVRRGAMVGLMRYGGIPGVLAAGGRLQALQASKEGEHRVLAAKVIGDVGVSGFYQPLETLLEDVDPEVRCAALIAAGQVRHPHLLPRIIGNLDPIRMRSTALTSLAAYGELILPFVENALEGKSKLGSRSIQRLVRSSIRSAGAAALPILARHIQHEDGSIRHAVLAGLNQGRYRPLREERERVRAALVGERVEAARISLARLDLGDSEAVLPMQRVLQDALTMVLRRSLLLVSFLYEARTILAAGEKLHSGDGAAQALVMESLDITLSAADKRTLFPLIDPKLTWQKRAQLLGDQAEAEPLGFEERLRQIAEGRGGSWVSSWLRTCAIHAIGSLGIRQLTPAVANAIGEDSFAVRETAVWALSQLDPEAFAVRLPGLIADPDTRIARLATQLSAA